MLLAKEIMHNSVIHTVVMLIVPKAAVWVVSE